MADISAIFGGTPAATFMGLPAATLEDLERLRPDVVVVGIRHATPYAATGAYAASAPSAIRAAVAGHANAIGHVDFDLEGPLLGDRGPRVVDIGDLPTIEGDGPGNRPLIRDSIRRILQAGAVPVVLGGDDSVPIPVLEAFGDVRTPAAEALGGLTILQLDAHIDWRDEVGGERLGLSSNMRRASEMAHVGSMVQAGQRGVGSARPGDLGDARARGVAFVSAREIHHSGIAPVLERIEPESRVYVNLDIDSLDPSIMPAVIGPAPGGLAYWHAVDLLAGVAEKASIVGFSLVEFTPDRDRDGLAALTAARIVANVIGLLARA